MVLWVFGYGSLIWNPGFDFDEKLIGYIKDYKLVFDLACIDHRGTPEHPARTCTLEKSAGAICWGVAYCVRGGPEKEKLAMEYLERRECEYDSKTLVEFYTLRAAASRVHIGTKSLTNTTWARPAPQEEMAMQIATASGPCGNNREYLFKLEKAMHDIEHEEKYVTELANEVRKHLDLPKEGKALLKPVVSRVPIKTQSQAHVSTRQRVFAS
ncbi:hypothetical protein Bca4012_079195 [Brassica carinata]